MNWRTRHMFCIENITWYAFSISFSYNSLFSVWFDVFYLDPNFAPFWTRSTMKVGEFYSNRSKTFSIELHKANLLGLEVQYYPYPAPLSPFQAGPLAQMPKLPAQMWPPGPQCQGVPAGPQSSSSSSGAAAAQPTSVSLHGAVCAFKKENLPCVEHY